MPCRAGFNRRALCEGAAAAGVMERVQWRQLVGLSVHTFRTSDGIKRVFRSREEGRHVGQHGTTAATLEEDGGSAW